MTADPIIQEWMRRHPELSEDAAMADCWHLGYMTNETYPAFIRQQREVLDRINNVFHSPDYFLGWHVASARMHKPGVYRFEITRRISGGAEQRIGFCKQQVLTTAIEQGLCTRPNGFTMS